MKPPARRWWLTLVGVIALLLLPFLVEHVRGVIALRRWQARMRARGQPLTIAELTPPPPTNPATHVVTPAGVMALALPVDNTADYPPSFRIVAPGRAWVVTREVGWEAQHQTTNTWEAFTQRFANLRATLPATRAALTNHNFVVQLDYDQGFEILLPHLAQLKGVAQILAAAALVDLREGRLSGAHDNLLALLAVADIMRDERLVIDQLVRQAIVAFAIGATWDLLQTPGWTDAQLADLQHAWESVSCLEPMRQALAMERAMADAAVERGVLIDRRRLRFLIDAFASAGAASASSGETGWFGDWRTAFAQFARDTATARARILLPVWLFSWAAQDQLRRDREVQRWLDGCTAAAQSRNGRGLVALPGDGGAPREGLAKWYDNLRFRLSDTTLPPLERSASVTMRAEALRTLTVTAIALQRFHLAHDSWPANLAELVPAYLARLPADYYDGRPLRYRRQPDGTFLLYSVGADGEDNGGDARPRSGGRATLLSGRDLVWPQPATAADLHAAQSDRPDRLRRR